MVVDLRNFFRRMIQVGFINGIGLMGYSTGYIWGRSQANALRQQSIFVGMTKLL
jgi:hypothetical protein